MEKLLIEQPDLCVHADPETGGITQITLYGTPLLAGAASAAHTARRSSPQAAPPPRRSAAT
jgi:hypothetical protein